MPVYTKPGVVSDTNGSVVDVLGVGPVPEQVPSVVQPMIENVATWAAAPGNVFAGQQPQTPGMWSDVDEAIAQANAAGQYQWGPETAMGMVGAPGLTGGVPGLGSGIQRTLMFSEGGATVHKLQKSGRWPTFVATSPSGEAQQFKDFEKAKQWAAPPEVQRPDAPASPMEIPPWEKGIQAYHGSPHDFEQFDIGKIGAGEGHQAYGHGLYFAEEPKVAEEYKRAIGMQGLTGAEKDATLSLKYYNDDKAAAIKSLQDYLKKSDFATDRQRRDMQQAIKLIEEGFERPKARMYEVDIKADPEHFLDWDKTMHEQSPAVLKKMNVDMSRLEELAKEQPGSWYEAQLNYRRNQRGQHIWQELARTQGGTRRDFNPAAAMKALKDQGVPGIKYLDAGSRDAVSKAEGYKRRIADEERVLEGMRKASSRYAQKVGETQAKAELKAQEDLVEKYKAEAKLVPKPTYNYVVFDDKLIDIVKKYGLAGLIAGGASNWSPDQAKAGEVVKLEGKNPYGILGMTGKTAEEMAAKNKQNQTRATLMRALGGGADVLQIDPNAQK